jgi:hypothetical protein
MLVERGCPKLKVSWGADQISRGRSTRSHSAGWYERDYENDLEPEPCHLDVEPEAVNFQRESRAVEKAVGACDDILELCRLGRVFECSWISLQSWSIFLRQLTLKTARLRQALALLALFHAKRLMGQIDRFRSSNVNGGDSTFDSKARD